MRLSCGEEEVEEETDWIFHDGDSRLSHKRAKGWNFTLEEILD